MNKIIDTEGFNAVVKGKYGYVVYNKNDMYIGKAIEKYGEFSEYEAVLFRELCCENDVIVEVGANIGTHTQALSKLVGTHGRVHAFEPQRIVFQTLCANMAINSITNVECYQVAASSEEGHVLIPDINYDVNGNFGGVEINKFNSGTKVRTARLDDFLEEIPRLKLLKVDVEGMEHEVISGAKKLIAKFKPAIYVENDRQNKSKDLIELLRSMDYRMFWHLPHLFNENNFAGDRENIYPGIVSVNMLCFHNSATLNLTGFKEVLDSDFHPMRKI